MKRYLIVSALLVCSVIASAFELGKSDAVIYYNAPNQVYAKELSFYLNKVFGKKYTLKAVKNISNLPGIFVGFQPKQDKINVPEEKEFTAISAAGNQLFIYGRTNKYLNNTGYAVAEFLEKHAGVRFLWPGELGTVADKKAPVTIKDGLDLYVPPFDIRLTNSYKGSGQLGVWTRHRKIGSSIRRRGSGFQHAFASLFPRNKYGKTNPEYYSLVTPEKWVGTPKPTVPTRTNEYGPNQICTSNPEVRRIIAEKLASHKDDVVRSISANDGFGFCECANCVAQDGKPRPLREYGVKDLTNRMYNFASDVAWQAHKINPKTKLGMFAYSFFDGVPDGKITFPPDTMFLSFCYIISFMDAKEEAALEKTIRGLSATGAKVHGREYWNTHYFLDYPLSHSRKIARNIKVLHECNASGITGEPGNSFAPKATDLYILMKMTWDPTLKREDILMDFCKKGFGEKAAPVMYELFEKIEDWTEKLTNNFSQHRGENYHHYDNLYAARVRGMAWCYNEDFQKMCESYYAKALKLADTPIRKERIRYIQRGTRYAKYVTDAMNGYADLAAAGLNMALTQPSGKIIRMEKKNLLKLANHAINAGKARRTYALQNSYGCAISAQRPLSGNTPRSRPWLFFAEKMALDLTGDNFNYMVNGAFEYNFYSWDVKTANGAELKTLREAHHDNEYTFKAICHAGQGISLRATLPAGSSATVTNERKISPDTAQIARFQLFVKSEGDPRQYIDVEFAGKKLQAILLPSDAEDGTGWKELRFKAEKIPAGDHTLKITLRNTEKEQTTLYIDDLVLKMKEDAK